MMKRTVAVILLLAFLWLSLSSCGEKKKPTDRELIDSAAERLFPLLRDVGSFSLDGSYSSSLSSAPASVEVSFSDSASLVGTGSVNAGTLSLSVTLTGERFEDGVSTEYEDSYALSGAELSYSLGSLSSGTLSLSALLPLAETAETAEAILLLFPLLSRETEQALAASGVGYGAEDLEALFCELASLYRQLLLRTGQGQSLTVPTFSGEASRVLAEHGAVTVDEEGDGWVTFTLPLSTVVKPLLDRLADLAEFPLYELTDRLFGAGASDRLLTALGSVEKGETLGALQSRLETALCGETAVDGTLLSQLDAAFFLCGVEGIGETVRSLSDLEATEALRLLQGDPSLSASDTEALLSELLSMTPSELLRAIGTDLSPSLCLAELAETMRGSSLALSLPRDGDDAVRLSFAFSGEGSYGYRSVELTVNVFEIN